MRAIAETLRRSLLACSSIALNKLGGILTLMASVNLSSVIFITSSKILALLNIVPQFGVFVKELNKLLDVSIKFADILSA